MVKTFRSHLEYLESQGKLLRVKKEVRTKHEIAAGIRKISDTDGPALIFENIKNHSNWKVAGGLFGTRKLISLALGCEDDEVKLQQKYLEFDQKRIKPKIVSTGPVKDVIWKGDKVDLGKLPIPTYCEYDAGPYLAAGVEIGKHPDTGIQNVSVQRRMILSKNETTLQALYPQHIGMMVRTAEERGESLGVATVIGPPPAMTIASQIRAPYGVDETEIAGAIIGEPIEMVKCETIDVYVPANAEVVIEGMTIPNERVADGPFGEVTGTYGVTWDPNNLTFQVYKVKITAITMRKDPIFHAMLSGMPMTEVNWVKKYAQEAALYRHICSIVPDSDDIKGINLTPGGGTTHHAVISIHKKSEGVPRNIILSLLAGRSFIWRVIVVDEDIDIYDPEKVEWAIMSRVSLDKDLYIMPSQGAPLPIPLYLNKWGIDATVQLGEKKKYYYAHVPGVEDVDYV
ncbi:UbiD family decarboxylase [Chloroflexota bacterium]